MPPKSSSPVYRGSPAAASSPTSENGPKLSAAEIQKRIREGNDKRKEAVVEEVSEKEKRLEEEREELVSGVQKAVNFIIALVFISMPMSEPEVDWLLVGVFVVVNLFWNLFLHKNTPLHMGVLLLWNFIITQYVSQIHEIPSALGKVSPLAFGIFFAYNGIAIGAGYYYYICADDKKKPGRQALSSETEDKIDKLAMGVIGVNILVGFVSGVITIGHVQMIGRSLWQMVLNLSIG